MKKINIQQKAIKVAGVGAGAYVGAKLNKIGFLANMKPALRGAIKIGVGAFLPDFLGKGKKAAMVEDAGNGMIALGALEVASAFDSSIPSLAGIGDIPTMGRVVFDEDYSSMNGSDVMGDTGSGIEVDM